jgi:hypothetical protein
MFENTVCLSVCLSMFFYETCRIILLWDDVVAYCKAQVVVLEVRRLGWRRLSLSLEREGTVA